MVDPAIVSSRINQLRDYLSKLRILADLSPEDFGADFKNVESAKHLLQVAIGCCLDLAQHIVADAGFRTPNDYYDAFVILSEHDIVPAGFLPTLRQMVSFRNRVVHLYWEVDNAMLYRILQENLTDFDTYVAYVLDYTESPPSDLASS
jgi:uncharacterized protein YutE (UPF0331/DUF86 family)